MNSPLFGESRQLRREEKIFLARLVHEAPVAVFQALNWALNKKGFAISINSLSEAENDGK